MNKPAGEHNEVIEDEIVLGDKELKQISEEVGKNLKPTMDEALKGTVDDAIASALDKHLEKIEKVTKKAVVDGTEEAGKDSNDPIAKGIEAGRFTEETAKDTKEMRLFKAAIALANNDSKGIGEYNSYVLAARTKAGYQNEGVIAEGGALVPDPEFDTTVYENLPKYGVAFRDADVRQTDRTSVRFLSLNSGLQFYATAEAGVKTSAKLDFTKELVTLQKYAVIVPSTDELAQDAAIDYWNLVTRELARAYAKLADQIAFTDATSGIVHQTGIITQPTSGAGTTVTWDDLLKAEGKTEDDMDTSGAKWYMRKETYYRLAQTKASGSGEYLWEGFTPNPNNPSTPWGTAIAFTRVLDTSLSVSSNGALAVYGDLSNFVLYSKRGMDLMILREATIVDTNSQNFNLATQDGTAMRAVVRLLGKVPKGATSKFVVVGTGTVS